MDKNEDLKGRTCRTCACSYLVEPPKVPTAQQLAADPKIAERPAVLICRLNPPVLLSTPMGLKPMQGPTEYHVSCWSWRKPGSLPGDPPGDSSAQSLWGSVMGGN